MNRIIILLSILLISYSINAQKNCQVSYISNEGFIIQSDNKKIAIDSFFDKIDGDWCDSPTDSMINLMKTAAPPFNDIDIIAITHKHRDHFDADVLIEHLLHNQEATILCPNQVYIELLANPPFKKIKNKIISITPKKLSDSLIITSETNVRIVRLEHSHYEQYDSITGEYFNKHQDIENIGFLFDINGTKIFHCGDINPLNTDEVEKYKLYNEKIDIAFLERIYFANYRGKVIETINSFFNPKHIILMHINPNNNQAFYNYAQKIENLHVFQNKMDSRLFPSELDDN